MPARRQLGAGRQYSAVPCLHLSSPHRLHTSHRSLSSSSQGRRNVYLICHMSAVVLDIEHFYQTGPWGVEQIMEPRVLQTPQHLSTKDVTMDIHIGRLSYTGISLNDSNDTFEYYANYWNMRHPTVISIRGRESLVTKYRDGPRPCNA